MELCGTEWRWMKLGGGGCTAQYKRIFENQSHGDEVRDFYDKEIPKVDSNHACLAVITLDPALKKDGNCYPQVFLKECKYLEKKVFRHFDHNLSDFSYYSGESNGEQMFFR